MGGGEVLRLLPLFNLLTLRRLCASLILQLEVDLLDQPPSDWNRRRCHSPILESDQTAWRYVGQNPKF
jgi:hypothetical protein